MIENIYIQVNDVQQFVKDNHDNKTVYGYEKTNLKGSVIILMNYQKKMKEE